MYVTMAPRRYRLATPNQSYRPVRSTAIVVSPRRITPHAEKVPPLGCRWWLVLPCLLLSMFAGAADSLVMNDFLTHRYEIVYALSPSHSTQREACRQSNNMPIPYWEYPQQPFPSYNRPDYSVVQRATASFQIKNAFATIIPSIIMFMLLGSNCDVIGRRPVLLFPFLGKVVRYALMLVIIARNLSDAWLIAAHALEAVFGSSGLVILSAFAFITDCTDDATRTRAFLITEVLMIVARIVPIISVSFLLRRSLYMVPAGVGLGLAVLGVLYILFIQPESMESV